MTWPKYRNLINVQGHCMGANACVHDLPDQNLGSVCEVRSWNMARFGVKYQISSEFWQLLIKGLIPHPFMIFILYSARFRVWLPDYPSQ